MNIKLQYSYSMIIIGYSSIYYLTKKFYYKFINER